MPKEKIESLLTELHESFGDAEPSLEQQRLMAEVARHVHDMDAPEVTDPTFAETAEMLVEELREEHPRSAAIVGQILRVLADIGV